ncbi:FtsK/SpoIIIE domain-containing protein [Planomonospora parontospora]|uniref:FtsK/SpoIIIE domain-containing protein n=1 Tax=Planomonospora parontospora TaxID=58119 RepID=UPI0016715AA2|nr:FtsK/SpoIIIE domain-containing protein [Planomonospora parontospora]GGL39690.1 conjugal transfer protein TraS [Planomonospora parontospora subsp. antibiotica]GII18108.1 conjugal transfer protein TraS [Planomonospora parontospora subsp. antibiotica]
MIDLGHPLFKVLAALLVLIAWRRWAPVSYWYLIVFPRKAVRLRWTWRHVASGCGLTKKRLRWWFTTVPGLIASTGVVKVRRRFQRVEVDTKPWMGLPRPTRNGFRITFHLLDGQVPDDYAKVCERLAHAWRIEAVRVVGSRPGRVTLQGITHDPLTLVAPTAPPAEPSGGWRTEDLLRPVVGVLENGAAWRMDFRLIPHWMNAGATQSGKSNLINALLVGLASQPVALIGFDLKGGMELSAYEARLTALATTRAECLDLLSDLVAVMGARMLACRRYGVRDIWQLPDALRPIPIVVLVDELAELFLTADKAEKDQVTRTATALLRIAQLGRALGLHLVLSGQRIGSDLGPGVTALRAQIGGRVCHRVNDPETAVMTLGDLDPDALVAARSIAPEQPGVAVVTGSDGRWCRARSGYVSTDAAQRAAEAFADVTPSWAQVAASGLGHELPYESSPELVA